VTTIFLLFYKIISFTEIAYFSKSFYHTFWDH